VDEFLAVRGRGGPLEFGEFVQLCNILTKSETRRLRWQQRMDGFVCEENVERMAHTAFQESADSSAGDDHFAPAELLEDIIRDMGLGLDADERSRLDSVCEHGRISQQHFVEQLKAIWHENPETRAAYTSLLRRRQLEERAEIEAVFALYDHDGSGSIDSQGPCSPPSLLRACLRTHAVTRREGGRMLPLAGGP
jgi:hypothetical protein